MKIHMKRIYRPAKNADGVRILVERLWPRGVSKEAARLDLWLKDAAPSRELREWFHHDPKRWADFRKRYFAELDANPAALAPLRELADRPIVTFVFASREERFNNAVALKDYIEARPGALQADSAR